MTKDLITVLILILILGLIIFYIAKSKKSGKKCIGCPDCANCSALNKDNGKNCGCNCSDNG